MRVLVAEDDPLIALGLVERLRSLGHEPVGPAHDGEVGILPGHAPMLTLLGEGVLRIGDSVRVNVRGGFVQVADNVVRVITEHAEAVK